MRKVIFCLLPLCVLAGLLLYLVVPANALNPPGPPGPSMKTLQEIYDQQDDLHVLVKSFIPPASLSDTTTVVNAGYYADTDLTVVEPDLTADNIRDGVMLFGIEGIYIGDINARVPKTGQTTSYGNRDDGELQAGIAWPAPRFTDHGDGTVTDQLTELVWLKNADVPNATRTWALALADVAELNASGTMNGNPAGDTSNSGSHQTDWRLPNILERHSLVDYGNNSPPLPPGHPFTNVQSQLYWTSTTMRYNTNQAYAVGTGFGGIHLRTKTSPLRVWPVRGGP